MQEFTLEEFGAQCAALQNVFDQIRLLDPLAQAVVDPATLTPTAKADAIPPLNAQGRRWQPIVGEEPGFVFYQAVQVEGRPFMMAMTYCMTDDDMPSNDREANALLRLLRQYREEMHRDYVTGVYNRNYIDHAFRKKLSAAACAGKPVSVVAARVNEYWDMMRREGSTAADCCLNAAAGILQTVAGTGENEKNTVVRLGDGVFAIVCIDTAAAQMERALHEALDDSRRTFAITLARRGQFSVTTAGADWGEAGSWELMLALAEQRLAGR